MEKLNKEQKIAVEHVDGPMLIIAGAGTGKTKVVTSRILHLIQNEGVDPSEILALTFTEKATNEMQERVDIALPLGHEEISIKTFHGFCDSVLKESAHEIGLDNNYRLISQTDASLLIKKNLFKFSLEYYRPLGNPLKFISSLIGHFGRLKDEDILPSTYLSYAQSALEAAEDEESKEEAAKQMEIANFYNQYQNFIRQSGSLDFGDLIFYVLRLFEKRKTVLQKYQNRFKYIMVDEFQDTNFAQSKMVHLLAASHKNIVVVGDDDQSIYKWRGASLSNILEFEKKYPDTKKVVLVENYRSKQEILDLSYGVIQNNNPYRLEAEEGLDKKLRAFHGQSNKKIQLFKAKTYHDEVEAVVNEIQKLIDGGASYSDVAILARTNAHLRNFVLEMGRRGIPFQISQLQGFFQTGVVKDLTALISFLINPFNDVALMRVLSFPGFGVDAELVLGKAHQAKQKQNFLWSIISQKDDQQTIPGMGEKELDAAVELLRGLIGFSKRNSIGMVMNEFLVKTGYLRKLAENVSADNEDVIARIKRFSEIVADYEAEQDGENMKDFLEFLGLLEESGSISADKTVDSNAVNLLTIHSSKGLEFPYVFVVSLVQNRFPSVNRRDPFDIPEELVEEQLPHDKNIHKMEERRLFYVACTRAKNQLYLSYSEKYEGSRKWKPSIFMLESMETGLVEEIEVDSGGDLIQVKTKIQFEEVVKGKFPTKASFSQLSSFERCPQQYRFRYLLRLPSPNSHAANFGSSLHNTLNAFYEALQRGEQVDLNFLLSLYERYWISSGYESMAHHNARKKKGAEILTEFYEVNSKPFKVPAFLERGFTLKMDKANITGRIDRIDQLEDGTYEIIDYKTGTFKRGAKLDKDLQLTLYALAAKDLFKIPVSKLSLYFLDGNEKISTERTDEQLENCRDEVNAMIQEMHDSKFEPSPGFTCQYCEYRLICDAAK